MQDSLSIRELDRFENIDLGRVNPPSRLGRVGRFSLAGEGALLAGFFGAHRNDQFASDSAEAPAAQRDVPLRPGKDAIDWATLAPTLKPPVRSGRWRATALSLLGVVYLVLALIVIVGVWKQPSGGWLVAAPVLILGACAFLCRIMDVFSTAARARAAHKRDRLQGWP